MSEEIKSRPQWARAILASALGTTNLALAGVAGVTAAALHSLPVLALGSAAYAALMAWDLATPSFWQKLGKTSTPPAPPKLPEPEKLHDPEAQRAARALLAAQKELRRMLAQSPESVQHYAELALGSVPQIEEAGARLLNRLDELSLYLRSVDARAIDEEIRQLEQKVRATKDQDAAAQFSSARAQRVEQQQTLGDLIAARDRVSANLSRIVALYESLPGRVVHMRALDAQAVDAFSGGVNQELDRMNHEIAAFEDTLKGLSARVPA